MLQLKYSIIKVYTYLYFSFIMYHLLFKIPVFKLLCQLLKLNESLPIFIQLLEYVFLSGHILYST